MGIKQDLKKVQKEIKRTHPGFKTMVTVTRSQNPEQVARIWNKTLTACIEDHNRIGILNKYGYIYLLHRDDHGKTLTSNFNIIDYRRWIAAFFEDVVLQPYNPHGLHCFICQEYGSTFQCQRCFKHVCRGCCRKMQDNRCPYCREPGIIFHDPRPDYMRWGESE